MKYYRLSQTFRRFYHKLDPWTALNNLDKIVVPRLGTVPGFFIEVGANDGVRQSNTYFLEKRRGWTGLLVEPIPYLAQMCERNRSKSIVRNCALVSPDMHGSMLEVFDLDLMSMIETRTNKVSRERIRKAEEIQKLDHQVIPVVGVTLSSLLNEIGSPQVDFFSLDVEGYELDVLRGLDFETHCPNFLLVETAQVDLVAQYVSPYLVLDSQLSHHDFLFVRAR